MDVFTMVAVIVVASMAYSAYAVHMKSKAKIARSNAGAGEAELTTLRADVEKLKDRVRVLEKIVTDQERQLAEEIRRLA